jgi:malate synthase
MEDAATAEISRTQLWQWKTAGVTLDSGERVDAPLINRTIDEQLAALKAQVGDNFFATGKYTEAADVFRTLTLAERLEPFLTVPAYEHYFAK